MGAGCRKQLRFLISQDPLRQNRSAIKLSYTITFVNEEAGAIKFLFFVGLSNMCYTLPDIFIQSLFGRTPAKGTHGKEIVIPVVV